MRLRRLPLTLVLAAALLAPLGRGAAPAAAVDPCGEPVAKADGSLWSCTFADDFEGTELDRSVWIALTSARTGTGYPYECRIDDPDNIAVADGALRLTVRKEPRPVQCRGMFLSSWRTSYTAGAVSTQASFAQAYGRFAVRAKFPDAKVRGLHSAIWMVPQRPRWGRVASGEIDIAEFRTKEPDKVVPHVHYLETVPDPERTSYECYVDRPEDFHEYVLEWSPSAISIWYDGELCLRNTHWRPLYPRPHPAPFNQPFVVNLNQSLGWFSNTLDEGVTPLPATMTVDYVRAWQ